LKKFGLQNMAENKLKDFLVNSIVYKQKATRIQHILLVFGIGKQLKEDEMHI